MKFRCSKYLARLARSITTICRISWSSYQKWHLKLGVPQLCSNLATDRMKLKINYWSAFHSGRKQSRVDTQRCHLKKDVVSAQSEPPSPRHRGFSFKRAAANQAPGWEVAFMQMSVCPVIRPQNVCSAIAPPPLLYATISYAPQAPFFAYIKRIIL